MPNRTHSRSSRPGRVGCGMLVALALVAAGVGGAGLGGWLLVGPRTTATPTRPTTRGTGGGSGEPTGKALPTKKADDPVVREVQVQFDVKPGGAYLYVTHKHPGDALEDVTLTVEVRGSAITKTTTHPLWEADRPLRVEIPPFIGKGRTARVSGSATQNSRPVRIEADVGIDMSPRGLPGVIEKKGKFGPPIPGATTPPPLP